MERERIERMKELARNIQRYFKNFYLTGGTALMFKYNYRISEDLDFFSQKDFSFSRLSGKIRKIFNVEKEERFEDNIDFIIDGIKVSFILFPFKNINPLENFEGIKIDSDYDIFLNKIYASGRRIESKDVIDFAFLWEKYKWKKEKVKRDFEKKFPNQSFEIYLGAVLSVEDYLNLDEKTLKIIEKVKQEWIKI
ncbi:MAG: nucleotidyl transferase AbiEii/AbiGii toxin family protein [Candidatus Ratteibacteria bacterium]